MLRTAGRFTQLFAAEALKSLPVSARGFVADVTDEASLVAVAAELPAEIDLLILNAGVNVMEGPLADVAAEHRQQVMTTNALGPLLAARALGGKVVKGGKLVALSSTLARSRRTPAADCGVTACRRPR